ncbi:MAG TPA: hypothetical protein PKZ76_18780 [Xanthomonadaceae bacterium]|nr:hypothetical protein [Xanthomonadaceae bacterium]
MDIEQRISQTAQALREVIEAEALGMTADQRVSEVDAARLLGVSAGGLKNMRHEGNGPPAYRAAVKGCRVSYRIADLARWIESRREDW